MKKRQRKKEVKKLVTGWSGGRLKATMRFIKHRRRPIMYSTIAVAMDRAEAGGVKP